MPLLFFVLKTGALYFFATHYNSVNSQVPQSAAPVNVSFVKTRVIESHPEPIRNSLPTDL
jgi:hypothetical protein